MSYPTLVAIILSIFLAILKCFFKFSADALIIAFAIIWGAGIIGSAILND